MSQEYTPEQLERRAHHFENAGILDIAAPSAPQGTQQGEGS